MFDQATSFLFTAGIPRSPHTNSDPRAQAQELLDSANRLRADWAEVRHRLKDEGFEAGEFALICRIHLNLLDNCAVLLNVLGALPDPLGLPPERIRSAAAEVKAQQDEIRPLYELASRQPPPLDLAKLLAAQRNRGDLPAVEVGELLRQIEAGEVEL